MHNLVFQSNSLDFSWKCEEEAEMPVSDWRQGEWARGTEGSSALFPKCCLENVFVLGRISAILLATKGVGVSS